MIQPPLALGKNIPCESFLRVEVEGGRVLLLLTCSRQSIAF